MFIQSTRLFGMGEYLGDYIWCLCKAKELNIHLEAILIAFGGNFGSFQSQKSLGANLPPPVSRRKFQSLCQIGLRILPKISSP